MQQEFTELRKEMTLAKKDVLYYYRCTLQYIKIRGHVSSDKGIYFEVSKSDYKKAANNNWSSCSGIKMTFEHVLAKRKNDLIKDYDMPESFFDESIESCKTFSKLYFRFNKLKTEMECAAQNKVKLNNIIYTELTLLLSNTQFIYRNRKDMQQLFQFDKLLKAARKKKKNATTAEAKPAVFSFLNKVAAMF
jgi:hypothetical protein